MTINQWLPWLLALPLLGALVNGLLGARLPRSLIYFFACAPILLAAAISGLCCYVVVESGRTITFDLGTWMSAGDLRISGRLAIDQLSAIMICVITGIGGLIHLYSTEYMDEDPSVHRYFSYLNLFVFAMLLLVLGDNMLLMFVGWEGVGLCSYLLIGFWFDDDEKASAGKKAFVVNRIGDFGVIIGTLILFLALGTLEFPEMRQKLMTSPEAGLVALVAALFLFLGATGKSAQIPLYIWLPDAMAGPTPVSALIHAATMVTAGIYMICRMSWLYTAAPAAMAVVAVIGALTAFFAATMAIYQTDIKKVLAYSTVSQLGYMFLGVGVGAFSAGFFHVFTHAFFKACLFLGSGAVIHALHHEQDIRRMGGLMKKLPVTCATFVVSTAAIMGFPGLSGFFSKDEIMWQAFQSGLDGAPYAQVFGGLNYVLWGLAFATACLTSYYMWRLTLLTFFSGKYRGDHHTYEHAHELPLMSLALIVLAIGAVVTGVLNVPHSLGGNAVLSTFLSPVTGALPAAAGEHHATEWALMAATVVGALAAFGLAYLRFGQRLDERQARVLETLPGQGFVKLLYNKWYVDELYERVIVRPVKEVSYVFMYKLIDAFLIDKVLLGVFAVPAKYGGYLVRWVQNGSLQRYATVFALGAVFLLWWVVMK